jgi:predicted DNA-binding ribbon-helix-helix protein
MTKPTLDGRAYADVTIELEREEWYQIMMMAHERDITLNQMVELLLRRAIEHFNESLPSSPV